MQRLFYQIHRWEFKVCDALTVVSRTDRSAALLNVSYHHLTGSESASRF